MAKATVEGVNELRRKLLRLNAAAERVAREEVTAGAHNVRQAAQSSAPRISGDLARSIEVVADPDEIAANIGTRLFYAPWVHFGTQRIRANPFLFSAFEAETPRFRAALTARLQTVTETAGAA